MNRRTGRRDDQAVAAVLAELRELRLRLSSDLSAASGAVETDEPAVAADILAGDSADLQRFLTRAQQRLADEPVAAALPEQRSRRRDWRRLMPALPAAAVLAGAAVAAAVVAPQLGQPNARDSRPAMSSGVAASNAGAAPVVAPASFDQLRSAIVRHESARDVLAAAKRWHQQLAVLIATVHDPQQLHAVMVLLHRERELLARHHVPDVGVVLAAAARLEQSLLRTAAPLISGLPMPSRSLLPSVPVSTYASPTYRQPTTTPSHVPSPNPSAEKTRPAPSHSPSPSPSPPTSPPRWTPPFQSSSPGKSFFDDLR